MSRLLESDGPGAVWGRYDNFRLLENPMTVTDLAPDDCPFCGSNTAPTFNTCGVTGQHYVVCLKHPEWGCGARTGPHATQDKADKAWSRRPAFGSDGASAFLVAVTHRVAVLLDAEYRVARSQVVRNLTLAKDMMAQGKGHIATADAIVEVITKALREGE